LGLEAGVGLFAEAGDAQIGDVRAFEAAADRLDFHDRPGQRHLERLLVAALDGELDAGIDGTAHLVDRLGEREAHDRLAVKLDDEVAGLDPGARRRGVVDRRHHLYEAVLHGDFDAEAAEFAAGLHLHLVEALGVEIARVRVEGGEHAVDGILHQLLVGHLLDIVGADLFEDVAEQPQLLIGVRIVVVLRGRRQAEGHQECGRDDRQSGIAHGHSHSTLLIRASNQGQGSIGRPLRRSSI
jgi:hypothetical protein